MADQIMMHESVEAGRAPVFSLADKLPPAVVQQNRAALVLARAQRNLVVYRGWLAQSGARNAEQRAVVDTIRERAADGLYGAVSGLLQTWACDETPASGFPGIGRAMDTYFFFAAATVARENAVIQVDAELAALAAKVPA